jgi:hypothetical protein
MRHGWRGVLAIALLVGITGGAVLTGLEVARRTNTAFDRMIVATEAWDVLVNPDSGTESDVTRELVAGLPEVGRVSRVDGVLLGSAHLDTVAQLDNQPLVLATDGGTGYDFARYQMLDGRMPDVGAADEVLLTPTAADKLGLQVGDTYAGKLLSFDDFGRLGQSPSVDDALATYNSDDVGQEVQLEVVGIGVPPDELVVDDAFSEGTIVVTPGFWERYDQPSAGYFGLMVELAPGATADQLRSSVEGVAEDSVAFQTMDAVEGQVDRAVNPEVGAVRVFTVIAALVALVIVGQAISRRLQLDASVDPALHALGLTRGERAGLGVGRMAVAGVLGAILAVAIAVLASPIGPVGVVRPAEPDPGIRVDGPVLLLGGLGIVLATVAVSVWPALRSARATRRVRTEAGMVSSALVRGGLRPPAVMGVRFALEPGPGGVPTRSTLVGAVTGVVLVAATVTFAVNLDHFVDHPDLYGTSWSKVITIDTTADEETEDVGPTADQLADDDRVESFSLVVPGQLTLGGRSVPAFALGDSARPLVPTVVEGRAPTDDDEVVLGGATLDDLGLEVGDTVPVTSPDGEDGSLRVVGRAVLPVIAAYPGSDKTTLGEGAAMTTGGLAQWSPEFSPEGFATRFAPGVDPQDVVDDIEVDPLHFVDMTDVGRPSDVASLERVRSTPLVLAALLTGLIALTVTHALGAAVRARRRELAVLRTFGFSRGQVVGAVATQASLIALVGLVIGLPLGVAAGRLAWSWVAHNRDAVLSLVMPLLTLGLVAAAVLVVANLVALLPGLRAARAHPASILRTE